MHMTVSLGVVELSRQEGGEVLDDLLLTELPVVVSQIVMRGQRDLEGVLEVVNQGLIDRRNTTGLGNQ